MNEARGEASDRLSMFGQPLVDTAALLPLFRRARTVDDLTSLLRLEDNYTAVYESGAEVWIVNSFYSLSSYFYALANGKFLHGDTLQAVASQGPVDLSWNHEAIANLLALEHLIGDETLARGVRHVPQGTILHWDGARLTRKEYRFEDFLVPVGDGAVHDRLVDLFLEGLEAGVGKRPIVTGSSGLDSRVNIAGMLHLGMRPEICVMGDPASKDVQIVQAMARAFDLRVNHVLLEPRDYLDCAVDVCRATSGIKPLAHWHSYILGKKSGYGREDHVVTGNNGEHVRGVGFDYGVLAQSLDLLSRLDRHVVTNRLLAKYWQLQTYVILRPDELRACGADFAEFYGGPRQNERLMAVMPPDRSFVWQSDAFILEQRRKYFQACGLKLFGMSFFPFSPYMRKSWVDAGWGLGLPWRLGSRWHRYAVERLCPALLEFAEEKEDDRMLRRQRPLAWVRPLKKLRRRKKNVPYVDVEALTRRRDIAGLLLDHASSLDGFMPRSVVTAIVDDHVRAGGRSKLVSILTGMAVWRHAMRATPQPRVPRTSESGATPDA
jgi:hypothetical protein